MLATALTLTINVQKVISMKRAVALFADVADVNHIDSSVEKKNL